MFCQTRTGEGYAIVDVTFNIIEHDRDDLEMEVQSVEFHGLNVIPLLTEDQMYDIEQDCWKASKQQNHDDLYDIGAERYQERMAA